MKAMEAPLTSLPFVISNVYQGLAAARGVATNRPSGLLLSFELVDEIVGWFKSDVVEVEISWSTLAQVEYKQGWFGDHLRITVSDMNVVQPIPRRHGAQFTLEVNRRQQEATQEFAREFRSALVEAQLRSLEEGDDHTDGTTAAQNIAP